MKLYVSGFFENGLNYSCVLDDMSEPKTTKQLAKLIKEVQADADFETSTRGLTFDIMFMREFEE